MIVGRLRQQGTRLQRPADRRKVTFGARRRLHWQRVGVVSYLLNQIDELLRDVTTASLAS